MKPTHFSVKNWERFQHYKDRDPPWVKLYRDLLTSESWVLGTDLSRVVQVASVMLAPRYSNKIPYRFDLLKKVMSIDCKESEFIKAVEHLIATEFFEVQELTKQNENVEQSASTPLATCTSETEQRRAEKRQSREDTTAARFANRPADEPPEFSDFKLLYPPRGGGNPWSKALKAINARLREGHTWPQILDGTRRYAAFVKATGKQGTEYVKHAASFCGPDKCFLDAWALPATKAQVQQNSNVDAGLQWLRDSEIPDAIQ